jgi:hypothetical protein
VCCARRCLKKERGKRYALEQNFIKSSQHFLYDAWTLMKQFFEELKVGMAIVFAGMFGWIILLSLVLWFLWYLVYL